MNKEKKFHLFYLLIISLLLSCNYTQKAGKTKLKITNKLTVKNNNLPVVIIGTTDDPKAFKYFNWLNMSYLFGENHHFEAKKVKKDSLYLRLDSIRKSGIMSFAAFGDLATYVNKVFVIPGDSILFTIKNKKLKFIGKNAAVYNFFINMDTLKFKKPYYKGNIEDYKTDQWISLI